MSPSTEYGFKIARTVGEGGDLGAGALGGIHCFEDPQRRGSGLLVVACGLHSRHDSQRGPFPVTLTVL